jgi:hypothetical protein
VTPVQRHAGHERLAVFLEQHRDAVFLFLTAPADISATNHESERSPSGTAGPTRLE